MTLVVTGTAIATRMHMMAVATINSISVNPRHAPVRPIRVRNCNIMPTLLLQLLNSDHGLRAIHRDCLHGRITRAAAGDCQWRLAAGLRHEGERYDRTLSRHSTGVGRTRGRDLQCSAGFILA